MNHIESMYLPDKFTETPTKDAIYFGIDLGTTYTLVATVDSKSVNVDNITRVPVKFISYRQRSPIKHGGEVQDEKVASIIAFHEGRPYCGSKLYELKGHNEFEKNKNIFYHWKLDFGLDRHPLYSNAITDDLNTPSKVAGKLLSFCRIGFTKNRDQKLFNTVITVPASFQMNQRKDVIEAANYANIDIGKKVLIDEPNAAFIGYFNQLLQDEKEELLPKGNESKNILIFDIGGGTCDLSILEIRYNSKKGLVIGNKAISRYNDIGGQDVDMLIAEDILYPFFLKHFDISDDMSYKELSDVILPQLASIGEMLKIGLCNLIAAKYTTTALEGLDRENSVYTLRGRKITFQDKDYEFPPLKLSAKQFEDLLKKFFWSDGYKFKYQDKFVRSIGKSVTEIIAKANLDKLSIDALLPVGGSSRNPLLIKRVAEIMPDSSILKPENPDKLVAEGAAVYSYFYHHFGISLINSICSETIGIEVKGNSFFPLIEKGTELPIQVRMPNFKIQSINQNELIVPVCMNTVEHVINEIKIPLEGFYRGNEEVVIQAKLDSDKVLTLDIEIEGEEIRNYSIENPFFLGAHSNEQSNFVQISQSLDEARRLGDNHKQRRLILKLLNEYYQIRNYHEVARLSDEYIEKYDSENVNVLNYSYLSNSNLGRTEAAKQALQKAIDLAPNNTTLRFNYSILISKTKGEKEALEYLEQLPDQLKKDKTIECKIVLLKKSLGESVEQEARRITRDYKDKPQNFSNFDREQLLRSVHLIAGEPYKYHSTDSNDKSKQGKVLIAPDKPKTN